MEWSNDQVIQLIEEYRDRAVLWDPTNSLFKVASKKNEAWNDIGLLFKVDAATVKSKMLSLLASFRRERHKEALLAKTGTVTEENRKPRWFAFTSMLFLMEKFQQKKVTNDEDIRFDGHNFASSGDNLDVESEESNIASGAPPLVIRPKPRTFLFPKRRVLTKRKPPSTEDSRMSEAIHLLKTSVNKKAKRDECDVFGELVAHKLRGYSVDTRNIVQHLVNNVLFEADMGKYDRKPISLSPSHSLQAWSYSPSSPLAPTSPQSNQEDTKCTVQYLTIDNIITPSGSGNATYCFNDQENNFTK